MGNSGSAHNINSERSIIDRNSHFPTHFQHLSHSSQRQYQLSRSGFRASPIGQQRSLTTEWRRSYPTSGLSQKESKTQLETPFKVLPELDKRLHLRATTNGAILNSGGTISGRKPSEGISNALSQRSKTFIHESVKEESGLSVNGRNSVHPEFTRSQTLLYVKARNKDTDVNFSNSNLSRMQRHTFSEPELINKLNAQSTAPKMVQETATRPSNRNKYTKKRRAPEAPPAVITAKPITKSSIEVIRNTPSSTESAKPVQHFAKNSDRLSKSNKATTKSALHQSGTFQRGHEQRNSVNGNHHQLINSNDGPKFAYRREKSSDAIMLKSRRTDKVEDKTTADKIRHSYNNQSSIPKPAVNNLVDIKNRQSYNKQSTIQKSVVKLPVDDNRQSFIKQNAVQQSVVNNQKDNKVIVSVQANNKTQRTFYFGMELEDDNQITDTVEEKLFNDGIAHSALSNYDMEYKKSSSLEESMNDNGLLVHIRPTLPRRQVETPSFSPALAWRSLLEEQDLMNKSKIVKNLNTRLDIWNTSETIETPIQPNRLAKTRQVSRPNNILPTWTPEQDLGDENDDRVKGLSSDDDSSSDEYRSKCDADNFLFYGSKSKKISQDVGTPIHTFSLSLPRDAHTQHTRGVDILNDGDACIYKSLQKADHYFKSNNTNSKNVGSNVQAENKGVTNMEGSNWLLHKNVGGLDVHTKSLEYGTKRQRLLSIEPQSIKYLTGGKHVMYLPTSNDQPNSSKTVQPEAQADIEAKVRTSRHFKSRQRHIPQSLQDKTPIFPIKSMNEQNPKQDDDKPFHQRFTFNNPVRMLEKKLYTDKSVKATKTQMSLEGELEALKKVEEDFQRNRANEKENIQHQLRLHFGTDHERFEQYHSLPISPVVDRFSAINLNDSNNKLFCRDDPEGCVSSVPFDVHENKDKKTFVENNILS